MRDIVEYLMKNYYSKYKAVRPEHIPNPDDFGKALELHRDKVVIVRDPDIKCVAIYITLSDKTYQDLEKYDISDLQVLTDLLQEKGDNFHFVLLSADGLRSILIGMDEVKRKHPKSVSWWNPDMTKLHKYILN